MRPVKSTRQDLRVLIPHAREASEVPEMRDSSYQAGPGDMPGPADELVQVNAVCGRLV